MIIAVDGSAASGKGTLAKRLAAHFDLAHLDTGGCIVPLPYILCASASQPRQ